MKLEEGMYVRLDRNQGIARIDEIDNIWINLDEEIYDEWAEPTFNVKETDILKASHKIEELLKKGDYVNGYMITGFGTDYYDEELDEDIEGFSIILGNEEQYYRIPPKDIKTVLTKEQFESMAYKVN